MERTRVMPPAWALSEWPARSANWFATAPRAIRAGAGIVLVDALLVALDKQPDAAVGWLALATIVAVTIATVVSLDGRPAAIAATVVGNVAAVLILDYGLHDVAQRGLNGLSLGAIYALGAVGLTLVYGILRLVNFAHGDLLTLGAYVAYVVNVSWGLPLVAGVVVAIVVTAAFSVALERAMWAPMRARGAGMLQLLIMAIGLAFVIRYGIQFAWGTELRQLRVDSSAAVSFLGLRIGRTQLIVLLVGVAALLATGLMLKRTLLGKRMRALSDSRDLAETSGIDTSRVIMWTWIFAGALAGLAGVFAGAVTQLQPELGFELLLPIFAAVVLGGIGNAFGALTAGLVLGLVIEWSTLVLPDGLKLIVGFVVLIVVLVIRPEGIFGRARTV
ncbi:branched-chain amino acid ABC transporter permease [Conexibacter woesei]|nr:branched-chain amino acid ABC transporter permease [Conexibacter woesei]